MLNNQWHWNEFAKNIDKPDLFQIRENQEATQTKRPFFSTFVVN